MKELSLRECKGLSPVAVSEPFQLFTSDAVMRMRQEVLSLEVLSNFQRSAKSLMEMCPIRLRCMEEPGDARDGLEDRRHRLGAGDGIAHVDISVDSENEKQQEIDAPNERASYMADEGIAG
ncbi:hypothetical protein DL767_008856 [Monosporascus sp. MG133]|nr:hypothetical protein DL767_008856 [Monosporascus sp. MG133]